MAEIDCSTRRKPASATLYQIQKDIPGHLWCGPAAIAAVTGRPVSEVISAVKTVRQLRGGSSSVREQPVKAMFASEVRCTLNHLGFQGSYSVPTPRDARPTFAGWRKSRTPEFRQQPLIVLVTGHFVCIAGNRLVDNTHVDPILASEYDGQRKLVRVVIVPGSQA